MHYAKWLEFARYPRNMTAVASTALHANIRSIISRSTVHMRIIVFSRLWECIERTVTSWDRITIRQVCLQISNNGQVLSRPTYLLTMEELFRLAEGKCLVQNRLFHQVILVFFVRRTNTVFLVFGTPIVLYISTKIALYCYFKSVL